MKRGTKLRERPVEVIQRFQFAEAGGLNTPLQEAIAAGRARRLLPGETALEALQFAKSVALEKRSEVPAGALRLVDRQPEASECEKPDSTGIAA